MHILPYITYITHITYMVGLVGISSIHRFSHDQTNSQLHKVCRCPRRRCRCLRVPTGPKNTRPRRKVWVVCVELSFLGLDDRSDWLQIECPTLQLRSWFDSSKKFWTSEKLLKICYFAGFPSSKVVVQVFMMNDGSFSPKVSGLCSCAPILADARHRGWSGIDGCVKKN